LQAILQSLALAGAERGGEYMAALDHVAVACCVVPPSQHHASQLFVDCIVVPADLIESG